MRFARGAKIVVLAFLLAWITVAFWNAGKPMPPGTHVISPTARVSDADIDFLVDVRRHARVLSEQLAAVDRAEQLIVLDQSPLSSTTLEHLVARMHLRPNLKAILITDPGNEVFGGTPAQYLTSLENAGLLVARVRLDRLRDSNALYSSLWRLCVGWWSDPFDEIPGKVTLPAWLRSFNFKSDTRQVLVADDGAGGWVSIIAAAAEVAAPGSASQDNAAVLNTALLIRGTVAHDIAASELQIAGWSADDDRLPSAPPAGGRGVGSVDVRFLTEGAIAAASLDAIAAARGNDQIYLAAARVSDRRFIDAALAAAARGVRLQVLLDPNQFPNAAVGSELIREGSGHVEVHWFPSDRRFMLTKLLIVRHGNDLWANLGSANFTRRDLADFNLSAAIEIRLPARALTARAITDYFNKIWLAAGVYSASADEPRAGYWRYRLMEASGLSSF